MNLYSIGDIHGNLIALKTLVELIRPTQKDIIIFLGDYVDRGSSSKEVIDYVISLKKETQVITLRGNHEIMMLESRNNYHQFTRWKEYGGIETLTSYNSDYTFKHWSSYIPDEHWQFLKSTIPYFETKNHIFVHASLEENKDLQNQTEDFLYWRRHYQTKAHQSGKTIICGHTSQKNGKIHQLGHSICIDTWPLEAWLTCLEINSYAYWQANENGQTQQGSLIK